MPRQAPPPALDEEMDLEATCAIIGCSPDDLIAELERRQRAKVAKMHTEMALAAKSGGERRILRTADNGDGRVEFMIHPVSYHYWGKRLGYECWENKQFVREYLRDNPAARVKTVNDRKTFAGFAIPGARPTSTAAPVILDAAGRPMAAA